MAKKNAEIVMNVKIDKAVQQLNSLGAKVDQLGNRVANAVGKGNKHLSKNNQLVQKLGRNIGQAAMAMTGFGSAAGAGLAAFSAIKAEVMAITSALDKAKGRTLDYGKVMRAISFETAKKQTEKDAVADRSVAELSRQFQLTPDKAAAANLFRYIHGAEATLKYSEKARIATTLASTRYDMDPAALQQAGAGVATAIGRRRAAGDETDIDTMIKEQMGTYEGFKSISRVTDPTQFYQNVVPLGAQLEKFGLKEQEALLVASAATLSATDVTGTETRTALTNLFGQLEEKKGDHGIAKDLKGMDLLRAIQTRGSSKLEEDQGFVSLQKDMLGVFADLFDKGESYESLKKKKGTLRGKSRLKFIMMDLLKGVRDEKDATNIMNRMKAIIASDEAPAEFDDFFRVKTKDSLEKARERYDASHQRAFETFEQREAASQMTADAATQQAERIREEPQAGKRVFDSIKEIKKTLGIWQIGEESAYKLEMEKYGTPEDRVQQFERLKKQVLYKQGVVDPSGMPYHAPMIGSGRVGRGGKDWQEARGEARTARDLIEEYRMKVDGQVVEMSESVKQLLLKIDQMIERERGSVTPVEIVGGQDGSPGGQNNNPAGEN
jgi:hypothetical protein